MRTHGLPLIFVEDVAVTRDLIMDCLQEHEYEVVGAATAEDAMQRLASGPAPSLAVTDIDLGAGAAILSSPTGCMSAGRSSM